MAKRLKDENKTPLALLLAANLAAYYLVAETGHLVVGEWVALIRDWKKVLPSGLALLIIGFLNAQLSADAKARLVFWRWKDPLPGSRAFTRLAPKDARINMASIEGQYGPLPREPREQNSLWYRLYKSIETDDAVDQAHREFLLARDYATISFMIFVVLGVLGFFQFPTSISLLAYLGLVGAQYLMACRAAQTNGQRLVTTVLALKGAGK